MLNGSGFIYPVEPQLLLWHFRANTQIETLFSSLKSHPPTTINLFTVISTDD